MYPRFDSAAGLGQIPLIPGQIPYLILRVTGLDSASGPIPGNGQHWLSARRPRRVVRGLGVGRAFLYLSIYLTPEEWSIRDIITRYGLIIL